MPTKLLHAPTTDFQTFLRLWIGTWGCWCFLESNLCGNPLIRWHTKLQPGARLHQPATIPTTPTRAATRIKISTLRDTLNFEEIFFSYPQNILFWSSDNILFDALKCLGVFYKICTCDFVFCKTSNILMVFFFIREVDFLSFLPLAEQAKLLRSENLWNKS